MFHTLLSSTKPLALNATFLARTAVNEAGRSRSVDDSRSVAVPRLDVLLAGGKSGGHVFPALAVASELEALGLRVGFIGTENGLEAELCRRRGLAFFAVAAEPWVGATLWRRVKAAAILGRSTARAWRLLRSCGASVVVGTGGFVSAPAVIAARLRRRPVVLIEPNAQVGLANRLLSRLATLAVVGYTEAAPDLHCVVVETGIPVRSELFAIEPLTSPGSAREGLELLALGGSQGSLPLNRALPKSLRSLSEDLRRGLRVRHQTGPNHVEATRRAYEEAFGRPLEELRAIGPEIDLVPFVDEVPAALRSASLVVSRAGAITLAELCAAGRPAVLVPLQLAGAHQAANAAALAAAGAAVVVPQEDDFADRLAAALQSILEAPERLSEMGRRARSLARSEAAETIAEQIARLVEMGKR